MVGIGAGSYSYAQKYKFYVNPINLRQKIEALERQSPNFKVLDDEYDIYDKNGNYHMYIFCPNENEFIHIFIEPEDKKDEASLLLVGFSKGKELGNWKNINIDFDTKENLLRKKKFRDQVLNELHLDYKNEGNSMFVFWK